MNTRTTASFRLAVLVASLTVLGCQRGAPTAPSRLQLPVGPQWLSLIGYDLDDHPSFPACTGIGSPRSGKSLTARLILERDGERYLGRSTAGNLQIEIRDAGTAPTLGVPLVGVIRGSAADTATPVRPAGDVRVELTGTGDPAGALVEGTATISGSGAAFLQGRITGLITFSDEAGNSGVCSAVFWTMQAIPPGL